MQATPSIAALSAALAKAHMAFKPDIKDAANPFFKSKYADLAGVIEATSDALSANGLAVIQATSWISDKVFLETVITHSSGECVGSVYPIIPIKPDPQGYGSALTYARRYAMQAMLNVAAEDDDGNHASGNQVKIASKIASVTGAAVDKIPKWSDDQKKEIGSIFSEVIRCGGKVGEQEIDILRYNMKYDQPSDVIDAASELMRKWQDINAGGKRG